MVHSVSRLTRGVQVKLWDPLITRAIPERLRGVFTTKRYTNPRLPLPYHRITNNHIADEARVFGVASLVLILVYFGLWFICLSQVSLLWFQIWCEQTDPQKFVYEDINIAAYFLVRCWNAFKKSCLDLWLVFGVIYICGNCCNVIVYFAQCARWNA